MFSKHFPIEEMPSIFPNTYMYEREFRNVDTGEATDEAARMSPRNYYRSPPWATDSLHLTTAYVL